MDEYQVYYLVSGDMYAGFLKTVHQRVEEVLEKCRSILSVPAENIEHVFSRMQAETSFAEDIGLRKRILELGLTHTSMSVGDVVQDPAGAFWECRPMGWHYLGPIGE